jgi:hypothetical protein
MFAGIGFTQTSLKFYAGAIYERSACGCAKPASEIRRL